MYTYIYIYYILYIYICISLSLLVNYTYLQYSEVIIPGFTSGRGPHCTTRNHQHGWSRVLRIFFTWCHVLPFNQERKCAKLRIKWLLGDPWAWFLENHPSTPAPLSIHCLPYHPGIYPIRNMLTTHFQWHVHPSWSNHRLDYFFLIIGKNGWSHLSSPGSPLILAKTLQAACDGARAFFGQCMGRLKSVETHPKGVDWACAIGFIDKHGPFMIFPSYIIA